MRKFILPFLFIIAFFQINESKSQTIKKFTNDPVKFIEELKLFFSEIDNKDNKKEAKDLMEAFPLVWNSGKFTEKKKEQIYNISNLMLKRKMKPFPQFKNYLSALTSFVNTNQTEASFTAWQTSLEKLINKSTSTQFVNYLEVSNDLFSQNILYSSNTTTWKSSNNNYTFEFDSIPKITFPSLTLVCYANKDSAVIWNTKGVYYPTLNKWVGIGGKVDWKRAGFAENSVWADLKNYEVNVKLSKYDADSVNFYNKSYFPTPLLGNLSEKVLANVVAEKATYPQFDSYDKRLKINSIFENIDYEGGFSMNGSKFIGSGNKTQNAFLYFKRDGKKFVVVSSKAFIVRKEKISANPASVTIYWENDSIYHPGLQMKYIQKNKELSLFREENGLSETPLTDSYHDIDMYVEAVYWQMDKPKIDFKMIKGVGTESSARFESDYYFSEPRYERIQGIDEKNPIQVLKDLSVKKNSKILTINDIAKYMTMNDELIIAMCVRMATKGFLMYNAEDKIVTLKDRLFDYINYHNKRKDYDVIQFKSEISGAANASLNLLNFDLRLRGVKSVFLSDSQSVYIYPTERRILLKKGLDFLFDGHVKVGLFDFYGYEFSFTYDKFQINMPSIDSLSFLVKSKEVNEFGEHTYTRMQSSIEGVTGDLLIDHPQNKSGLKPFDKYPYFISKKDSYVYYEKKKVQNGVYTRDRFYYHLEPFVIDSLNNFSTEGLEFKGYLASGGIFPDISKPLKVMPDFSLGFVETTPAEGFPAYGGKGTFISKINLSNNGLKGDGTLNYLTSISNSDEFVFHPDSMFANVQTYEIKEQISSVEYPPVTATDVFEQWYPYKDLMVITKKKNAMTMFNGESKLHGKLFLTPEYLNGTGMMEFKDAEMDSRLFKYKQHVFDSDTTNFRLKSLDLTEMAFSTENYNAHVDYKERKGEFKSNGGNSKVEFPLNQYICYMDEFTWFMDKKELELSDSKNKLLANTENMSIKDIADIDLSGGSEFVSIHPAQDSLRFFSPKASYSLKNNIIYTKEVKYIKVADADIFPDKGDITILKHAEMKTLEKAQILANTATKYHTIYNATVNILSRKKFTGTGSYDYVDETGKKQPIFLNDISVDTSVQTYAKADIPEILNFTLSPDFAFIGKANLLASKEFLNFDGGFKIKHNCDTTAKRWIRFNAEINPNEIYIPIPEVPKDMNKNTLTSSIMIANDSNAVYSAFLARKVRQSDADIINANGFIFFDKVSKEYRISNKEKLKQLSLPGNFISLNTKTCITYGEGKMNLGVNLGQVKMDVFGNVKHYIIPDSATFDLVMALDYFFADDAMKLIAESMEANTTLKGADVSSEKYSKAINEILGVEKADKYISDVSLGVLKKLPPELIHTLFVTDVKMKWNTATKSYLSSGPIGIGSMSKTIINKAVTGGIEIVKKRSSVVLNIYLELDNNEWYFFSYSSGLMQAISSDAKFNKIITEMKPENRELKTEKGQAPYGYNISTVRKKTDFLKKFKNINE
ncbi:MAG: hypothetical protein HXX09_07190 [Bacteroidetes bacterium]|nr:hypothetical protein [Bacteroidota bacterium]